MSHNAIGHEGLQSLALLIQRSKTLKHLKAAGQSENSIALASKLVMRYEQDFHIHTCTVDVTVRHDRNWFTYLLQEIGLDHRIITYKCFATLSRFVYYFAVIVHGDKLSYTSHAVADIVRFHVDAWQYNVTLESLDLGYNVIGEQSGIYVAYMLANNYGLASLVLRWNHLRHHGANFVLKSLQVGTLSLCSLRNQVKIRDSTFITLVLYTF